MAPKLSVFWSPQHKAERPDDIEYIRKLNPYDILILQPDVQDVIDAHIASQHSEIVLRWWELDDNRGNEGADGVYGELRRDPRGLARRTVEELVVRVARMEQEAKRRLAPFPDREQLICHLVNEPDTNDLMEQINLYTVEACEMARRNSLRLEALNLGTGHPAHLNANGEPDWSPLNASLDAIVRGNHYAVVHEYFNQLGVNHESTNPWHIFRHQWAPRGPNWKIGEFGLENLVNHLSPGHQGWQGVVPAPVYMEQIEYYMRHVREDVKSVRMYMTDYRDPVWATFDTRPIHGELAMLQARLPAHQDDNQDNEVHIPVVLHQSDYFGRCVDWILKWEGGYVNDPADPGGETHWGISKRSYPDLDIRNLTKQEAIEIYRKDYWEASRSNTFPWPLCLVHFNASVNTGIYRASTFLEEAGHNPYTYLAKQLRWYTTLSLWPYFGMAWTRRMADLLETIAPYGNNL